MPDVKNAAGTLSTTGGWKSVSRMPSKATGSYDTAVPRQHEVQMEHLCPDAWLTWGLSG